MAEGEGFEPSRRLPAYTRSRRAPSTTRPPLRSASAGSRAIYRDAIATQPLKWTRMCELLSGAMPIGEVWSGRRRDHHPAADPLRSPQSRPATPRPGARSRPARRLDVEFDRSAGRYRLWLAPSDARCSGASDRHSASAPPRAGPKARESCLHLPTLVPRAGWKARCTER